MVDFDLDTYLGAVDASAAELLAALEDLCKWVDEIVYNVCATLLVFENETLEDQDDIEGTRSATAL